MATTSSSVHFLFLYFSSIFEAEAEIAQVSPICKIVLQMQCNANHCLILAKILVRSEILSLPKRLFSCVFVRSFRLYWLIELARRDEYYLLLLAS